MVKSRKILKQKVSRRIGHKGDRLVQDINVYRWFCVFIKCALELEGKSFTVSNKVHKLKFDRNHKWWKMIDLKQIKKASKLINPNYKLVPKNIDQLFNGMFMPKYRELFNEKSTLFEEAIRTGYSVIQVPPNYPSYKMIADIKHWYSKKEVKLKFQNVGKGKSNNNADIVLDTHTSEDLMKRLFQTLRIDQTMPKLNNLEKYFERTEVLDKKFKRPEIVRSNMKGARDTRVTQTNRMDFISQIRSTQRDIKYYKILLLNLGKGVFPKFDNLV
jgi:hypothetical protein